MIRQMIKIDRDKCNGCGLCVTACHESAIEIKDGKARVIRDDYCDGLGNCLPVCPTGAISFEEREAAAFDEEAVKRHKEGKSALSQWPVQIKLLPVHAPYYEDADLLVAADCTAYAYGNFHQDFLRGKTVLVGCPKLDAVDYSEKLTAIFSENRIRSITLVRMWVPCCGGMQSAVERAIQNSGKEIPYKVITLSAEGEMMSL